MAKKEKNEKILSLKETVRVNTKALRIIYQSYPLLVISRIVNKIWSAVTPYVEIYISALIIEELTGNRNPERLKFLVLTALFSAAGISLVSACIRHFSNWAGSDWFTKHFYLLSQKMLDMDFCVADDPRTHSLMSAIRQNANGGGWGIGCVIDDVENLFSSVFTLLGGIALTVSLFSAQVPDSAGKLQFLNNPLFILLLVAVMLFITYLSPALITKADSYSVINSDVHNLGNRLFGYFGFLGFDKKLATDMRIYRQDKFCEHYNRDKTQIFHSQGIYAKLNRGIVGLLKAISAALPTLFIGLVYLFVCLKARAGAFGVGMITQYIRALTKLSSAVSSLLETVGDMRNNGYFIKQAFEYLDMPNVMYQGSLTIEKRRDRQYEVEFKDVSFRYPGSEQYALRHVNMKFQVGQRLAVVGQNGSGKTTFIKLLCRLYDPTEGAILLNGIDIRKYNYQEYLSIFSVVFQDFTLTHFSLGQNVAASIEYDNEKVTSCLEKAGFGDRLKELPLKCDTPIGKNISEDGVDMSGGERQKIAIARTLYKDAPFIVLDEPTAALDPIAEAEIYSKFNEIIEDKTAIYISHRLSSCKFCDEILVFDNGRVLQQGTHDTLVADKSGKYHQLWHAQAQYYSRPIPKGNAD